MIVAGFGLRAAASVESLAAALALTGGAPAALAAPADKCALSALRDFAMRQGLPLIPVAADALAAAPVLSDSAVSRAARGTGSVAEAAALAAAGPGARLLGPRVVSPDRMATCALAEGEDR